MFVKFCFKPRDRSLKAFKEWFQGYHNPSLKPTNNAVTKLWLDERQWIAYWKMFWAKVDGPSNQEDPRTG